MKSCRIAVLALLLAPAFVRAGDAPKVGTLVTGPVLIIADGKAQALKPGSKIPANQLLITPPGMRAVIDHPGGAKLTLAGNLAELSSPPVQEVACKILATNAADVDIALERGRIFVEQGKDKKKLSLRLRFLTNVWTLELTEPGTTLAIERYNRLLPGVPYNAKKPPEPAVDVVVYLIKGEATLTAGGPTLPLKGQVVFKASNVGGVTGPLKLKELPGWLEGKSAKESAKLREQVEKLTQGVVAGNPGAVIRNSVELKNPTDRALMLPLATATNDLSVLIFMTSDPNSAKVGDAAVVQLRYWLGQEAGRAALLKEKLVGAQLKPGQAEVVLGLLYDFSDADLGRPETYELLQVYLKSDLPVLRELARWHLYRLVPAGRSIAFDAVGSADDRNRAVAAWAKLIPAGKLPPGKD